MQIDDKKASFLGKLASLQDQFTAMRPELEVTLRDPSMGVEGFVVVWNTAICADGPFMENGRGMGKGGTRIMPGLSLGDVRRLARSMAKKNAAAGLPLGGAKSGLNDDPNSSGHQTRFRRFVRLIKEAGLFYEDGGIFGGLGYDVGGKPPYNALWTCDELKSTRSFTGKPVDMGGTDYDKEGIAGLGVAVAARTSVSFQGKIMSDQNFAVQGIGAMGSAVVRYFSEFGGLLASVSDPKIGGTWRIKATPSSELIDSIAAGSLERTKVLLQQEAYKVSDDPSASLYENVAVVFPCALEDSITSRNADNITAPIIAEGANNPSSQEAKESLYNRRTLVVPDIVSNPGGIIAAFVELAYDDLSSDEAENAKVKKAKQETIQRIETNIGNLLALSHEYQVRPDQVADYMAYSAMLVPQQDLVEIAA